MTSVRSDIAMSGTPTRGREKSKKPCPLVPLGRWATSCLAAAMMSRLRAVDPRRIHEIALAWRVNGAGECESFCDRRWLSMLDEQRLAQEGRCRERCENVKGIVS